MVYENMFSLTNEKIWLKKICMVGQQTLNENLLGKVFQDPCSTNESLYGSGTWRANFTMKIF